MSSKRELTVAQQALNEAVRLWMRGGDEDEVEDRQLAAAYREFDRVRRELDGDRPASARDTSIAAAKTRLPLARSMRYNILLAVVSQVRMFNTGMTTDELERRLKKSHQTVSPAVNFLEERGWLVDRGERRETRTGSPAIVYYPTDIAMQEMLNAAWPAEVAS